MDNTMGETLVIILFSIFAAFLVIVLVLSIARRLQYFSKRLRYLKLEIRRTSGRERKYWIRKKRKLWLSWLPFFHE